MKKKIPKPKKAGKALADLFTFLHGQLFEQPAIIAPPAAAPSKSLLEIELGLRLEPCCLEVLLAAIHVGVGRGIFASDQVACLASLMNGIQQQLAPPMQAAVRTAMDYAMDRDRRREGRRLFDAAMTSPSRN